MANFDFAAAWYCARTKPKHERLAAAGVHQALGLDFFHPCLRMERSTRRGVVRVTEPLFPGYVFVHCISSEQLDQVRYIPGVTNLVQFGQRVATVPDSVIRELMECFAPGEAMAVEDSLGVGMEVTVAQGPFQGFRGRVTRLMPARQRVQVLLDFLGRTTVAEVDRSAVVVENERIADLLPALALCRGIDVTAGFRASA